MVSWFISPWEAARFSMEAQRLIALQFFGFAFPQAQPKKQSREERASGEGNAALPRQAPTIAFAEDVVTASKAMEPAQKKTVAGRNNKAMGTRKRKSKARKQKNESCPVGFAAPTRREGKL
jgi:hypothetical protein